ncbi:DNA alkylation repair protein [Streptomyces ipomoeae]|uniref:DNA alkylation repair protein n=1 Tax=Streptomyces ipomoeae TaxID=103232 RepID=UPI001146BD05|nr:DNA alkylation repair protein [Streptomyces ipomoeae]MDX2931235.1 DNA alkylation repair protein [Streptomyces ipomoeae]TQE16234.1 DNA alkylation repair protein [Streptomyces ipomoeae]
MTGTEGSGPVDAAAARLVGELTAGPRGAGDPRTTEETRRYLKSDLQHYGVKTPVVRELVADAVRAHGPLDHPQLVSRARALWHPEVHESRITAAILLERHARVLEAEDTALLEDLPRDSGTWALIDLLAGSVAGRLLLREPTVVDTCRRWAAEEHQWIRRSGVPDPRQEQKPVHQRSSPVPVAEPTQAQRYVSVFILRGRRGPPLPRRPPHLSPPL